MTNRLLQRVRSAVLLLTLALVGNVARAQIPVTIGSGTASNSFFPIYSCFGYNYGQQIYLASELSLGGANGASFINRIRFQPSGTILSTANWTNWTIFLGNTTAGGFANTSSWIPTTSMTQVFSGNIPSTLVSNQWMELILTTPFLWDGSSNLVVAIHESTPNWACTQNWASYNAAAPSVGTRGILFYSDPTNPNPASPPTANYTSNTLAQVQFDVTPATACSGTPNAGSATVTNANPCAGQQLTLGLSGNTAASGITYQWFSSTSATGPWTAIDTAKASPFQNILASTTNYYQALVRCGTDSAWSAPVLVTVPALFAGGTYTVDPSQPASGTNFTSISSAIAALSCGISGSIVLDLAPNTTFNEQVTIPHIATTSAANTITINGNGDTLRFDATTSTQPWVLGLNGADHIKVNNLVVTTSSATAGLAVHLWNDANANRFSNCTIIVPTNTTSSLFCPFSVSGSATSASTTGISGSADTVINSTLIGGVWTAFFAGNSASPNTGNAVLNSNIREFNQVGIQSTQQNGLAVIGCTIERPTRTGLSTVAYGVFLSTNSVNSLVQGNRIHNLFGGSPNFSSTTYAIYVTSTATTTTVNRIYNNAIGQLGNNSTTGGIYTVGATNIQIYHNTISLENSAATTGNTFGIYATGTAGVDVRNNNVSITRGGTGSKWCIYFVGAGKTSNYNNFYMAATGGTANHIGFLSTNFTTLANWQTANSAAFDQNSASVDPMFASLGTYNFTPTNSLLDNLGTPLAAVTVDINNQARNSTTPDIGAYEFSVPPCFGTPVGGTAVGPTAVCAGTTFTVSATGFSIAAGQTFQWEANNGIGWTPIAGATTTTLLVTGGITVPTDFRLVVTCTNGGGFDYSSDAQVLLRDFYLCYCSPLNGVNLNGTNTFNYLTNVTRVNGSLNNTNTLGGYQQYWPSTPNTTDTFMQGQQYTITTTHAFSGASYNTYAWIDYDHSGTFDTSEFIPLVTNNLTGTATFLVPLTANTGLTGLRIRHLWGTMNGLNACSTTPQSYETEDYVIYLIAAPQCTGTPIPGTASAPTSVCANSPLSLGLTGNTAGLGITVQWEQSPAGAGIWTPITGATNPSFTLSGGISSATDFRAYVSCSNGGGFDVSNTVTVTTSPFYLCYCSPLTGTTLHSSGSNYILRVGILNTSLNNLSIPPTAYSTINGGYTQFWPINATGSNTATLIQGITYTLRDSIASTGVPVSAWLDYDGSGTFDSSEFIPMSVTSNPNVWTGNFTIPISASSVSGNTGLRIRTGWNSSAVSLYNPNQACFNNVNGYETEDYVVNVIAPPPCSGTPLPGVAFGPSGICLGNPFVVQDTGFTVGAGIVLQWEANTGSGWAPIPGATNSAFTNTTQSVATSYRLQVTCTSSNQTVTSNVVTVNMNTPTGCYCAPQYSSGCGVGDDINTFTLVGANGTQISDPNSGCSPGAWDTTFTYGPSGILQLVPAAQYSGTISGNFSSQNARIWIDFNDDGIFGTTEQITTNPIAYGTSVVPFSITMPATATQGVHRMRVRTVYATTAFDPCGMQTFGETHDYWVSVIAPPVCPAPSALLTTAVAGTSATIDWTENGTATTWRLEYGLTGFTSGTGTLVTVTSKPFVLSGLSANTTYDVRVRSICSAADSSAFSNPLTFTTGQIPQSVFPYAQNWETGGTDWTYVNGSQTNKWFVGAPGANPSSLGGLYISSDNGLTNNYNNGVASVVHAFRDLDLTSFSAAVPLTFNSNITAEPGWDYVRVWMVPLTYMPVAGTMIASGTGITQLGGNIAGQSGWTPSTLSIPLTYTGTVARLVIEWVNDGSAGSAPVRIDNLTIGGFPLAIDLKDIKATNVGSRNRVDWMSASEDKGDKFELERSADGRNFSYLATISANGKSSTYSYWDEQPVTGVNYYRLKMTDAAGNSSYSTTVSATVKSGAFLVEAYPNPVGEMLTVKAYGTTDKNATITISDATGKVIRVISMENGMAQVNMNGMAQGMYLVKYADNNHSQIIKVHKK